MGTSSALVVSNPISQGLNEPLLTVEGCVRLGGTLRISDSSSKPGETVYRSILASSCVEGRFDSLEIVNPSSCIVSSNEQTSYVQSLLVVTYTLSYDQTNPKCHPSLASPLTLSVSPILTLLAALVLKSI